jgi:argininosuccinate synthase
VARIRDALSPHYGEIVYRGLWFSAERLAIQKLVDFSQEYVTGHVRVELYKGSCFVSGVKSAASLYVRDLVTLHRGVDFSADDATGFLRTMGLRYRVEMARALDSGRELPPIPEAWRTDRSAVSK